MKKAIITLLIICFVILGCEKAPPQNQNQVDLSQLPPGYIIKQEIVQTPEITSTGSTSYEKTTTGLDTKMHFKHGPTGLETMFMAQKPATFDEKGGFTSAGGGGTWFSMLWNSVVDSFWNILMIGGLIIVIIVAVYFFIPGAQPFINGILRGIASIFPIIGSLVEGAIGKKKVAVVQSSLENTVIGTQETKDAIDTMIDNTDFATNFNKETFKTNIRNLINTTLKANHDQTDEDLIAKIKQANRL